jgi:uncharacterized protein YbjT (DUF2867 family)
MLWACCPSRALSLSLSFSLLLLEQIDVFQGDLSNPDTLQSPVDGAVGIVIAAAPEWWRPGGSNAVEGRGPVALIEAAAAAGSVTRIVLLSSRQDGSQRAKNHLLAENALRSSGIPYLIVRVPSLVDEEGGLNTILLDQSEGDQEPAIGKALARVDAAQVVCQAFVYDRTVRGQEASSPPSSTTFRNVVVGASNTQQPVVLDTRKWSEKFASLPEVKR